MSPKGPLFYHIFSSLIGQENEYISQKSSYTTSKSKLFSVCRPRCACASFDTMDQFMISACAFSNMTDATAYDFIEQA